MDNKEKTNPPLDTVRDRALKAAIWANEGEHGPYLTVTFAKTYEDRDGKLRDGNRFTPDEALRLSELARRAFSRAQELGKELKQGRAQEQREDAPQSRAPQGRSRRNGPEQGY